MKQQAANNVGATIVPPKVEVTQTKEGSPSERIELEPNARLLTTWPLISGKPEALYIVSPTKNKSTSPRIATNSSVTESKSPTKVLSAFLIAPKRFHSYD